MEFFFSKTSTVVLKDADDKRFMCLHSEKLSLRTLRMKER